MRSIACRTLLIAVTTLIARAEDGQSVLVSSSEVKTPKYVRYGWANAPLVNLFNGAGLPASPFTSEEKIPRP